MAEMSSLFHTEYGWIIIFVAAILIGMSKTGIQGMTTLAIPFTALAFGAKESTGVILPLLCFSDIIAVAYYRRQAEWRCIFKVLPMAIIGFFVAIGVDKLIPTSQFKYLMAFSILTVIGVMIWQKYRKSSTLWVSNPYVSAAFGLLGGFTTMIGNAAGPVMAVYLLSLQLPKYSFIGTNAWFFLVINLLKVPLQIGVWHNITPTTLLIDACCIPFVVLGAFIGIWFVRKLPEKNYRTFITVVTVLSTLFMLL